MRTHDKEMIARTAIVAIVLLFLFSAAAIADSFSTTIVSFSDDAKLHGTTLETTGSDAPVGYTGEYSCGILVRFVSVPIPRHAIIDSAFIALLSSGLQSGVVCNAAIYAEDTGNASTFSTYSDFAARSLTEVFVYWYNLPTMFIFNWYRTPDVSPVIEEVVHRGDWSAGNALCLLIRDHNSSIGAFRTIWQYDYMPDYACSLIVYYTPQPQPGRRRRILVGKADSNNMDGQDEESFAMRQRAFPDLPTLARRGGRQ